jgi:cysteine desulfurase
MPEPSHVLTAMGVPHNLALGALRLSLGRQTTEADIDSVLEVLPKIIEKIRHLNNEQ